MLLQSSHQAVPLYTQCQCPPKLYGAQSWLHRAVGAWPTGFKERPPFILHRCVNTATEEPPHFPPDLHNSSPVHLRQSHLPFQLSHCVHLQDMAIWAASCQLAVKPSAPQGLIPPPPHFALLLSFSASLTGLIHRNQTQEYQIIVNFSMKMKKSICASTSLNWFSVSYEENPLKRETWQFINFFLHNLKFWMPKKDNSMDNMNNVRVM